MNRDVKDVSLLSELEGVFFVCFFFVPHVERKAGSLTRSQKFGHEGFYLSGMSQKLLVRSVNESEEGKEPEGEGLLTHGVEADVRFVLAFFKKIKRSRVREDACE